MAKYYFFLYLIYGFAFINMGIFSVQEKDVEVIDLPLVRSLKYLGYFGISHGISEWITMVTVIELYPDLYICLYVIKQLLKAISFAYLMYFGASLLQIKGKYKNIVLRVPITSFVIWLTGFLLLISNHGLGYHTLNPKYNTIILRYFMGFIGGLISAIALYLNAKEIEKRKSNMMARRYKGLACVFLVYSFLDGLIVRQADFFPANIINSNFLKIYFICPPQILKATVGIIINFLLIKVIDTFGWEQKEKINRLQKHRIASEERRKLGLEIHDSIIQGLYTAGMKAEYLIKNKGSEKAELILEEIKVDLTNTIDKTREFLSSTTLDIIEVEDLNDSLEQLVRNLNTSQDMELNLKCEISPLNLGQLSQEKSTQIYYIIQEAVSNIIKHSNASYADILLKANHDCLYIRVTDNGVGISIQDINFKTQFGISSMKERAERVGGIFNIEKIKNGTKVELMIPWEGEINEGQNKVITSR